MKKKIILASASPRRKALLEQLGLQFRVSPSNIEEKLNPRLKPQSQAEELSQQKAAAMKDRYKNAIIITADTLIVAEGEIIGKPKDAKDAKRILRKLSGKTHQAITGFTVLDTENGNAHTESVVSKVFVKKLTPKEIDWYVSTGEPMDKAGGYGIQEKGAVLIEKIDGDYSNVVGLPIFALMQLLKKWGVEL